MATFGMAKVRASSICVFLLAMLTWRAAGFHVCAAELTQKRAASVSLPTLLSKRLRFLCENGVIAFEQTPGVQGSEYRVTEAGEELRPFIELAGHWGQRWVRSRLTPDELNSGELMWYLRRHFQTDTLPP